MRRAGKINLTCEVVPGEAGVDLFEAGTTGASGGATRIGDEKLRLSDLAVDEAVENRGRSRGSGWPRGSGGFDNDGGGQGDVLANPSRRPPRRLSVSTKNKVERSGVGLGMGVGLGPSPTFLSASHLCRPTKGTKCWAGSDANLAALPILAKQKRSA